MQGQVNVAVMPHEHLTLVASHGLVVDQPVIRFSRSARPLCTLHVARNYL